MKVHREFDFLNELFLTLFYEYLPQASWYRAEKFAIASLLQSQRILKISCHLNISGLRSIEGLNDSTMFNRSNRRDILRK
jgi:hypothetical protein